MVAALGLPIWTYPDICKLCIYMIAVKLGIYTKEIISIINTSNFDSFINFDLDVNRGKIVTWDLKKEISFFP